MNRGGIIFETLDKLIKNTNRDLKAYVKSIMSSQMKSHRIMAGPLRGMRIVTSWRNYHTAMIGTTEPGLISWFQQNVQAGETWLDIGANYGYTALALRRKVGSQGRVFAFEPKLDTCGCLSQTMVINKFPEVAVIPMGLGKPDDLELRTLAVNGGMLDSLTDGERRETLVVSRLDWLWPRICGNQKRIDGVKLDVQGMELEVLWGMKSILADQTPKLVLELHRDVSRGAILDLLGSCGYLPEGKPICDDPDEGVEPKYHDNRSYVFLPKEPVPVSVGRNIANSYQTAGR